MQAPYYSSVDRGLLLCWLLKEANCFASFTSHGLTGQTTVGTLYMGHLCCRGVWKVSELGLADP